MDKFEFFILGSLIDFPEPFDNIFDWAKSEFPDLTEDDVRKALIELCKKGLISIGNKVMSLEEIQDNVGSSHYRQWGYGLTKRGIGAWEENSDKFRSDKIDWSRTYEVKLSYRNNTGYIYGTTSEICFRELNELMKKQDEEITINEDSIIIENVEEFEVEYYKKVIRNGYKIKLNLA